MQKQILDLSAKFWDAMEHADEAGMRSIADSNCNFVHIGVTCKLDKEIEFYTSGAFQPTGIVFHSKETTHHFVVTEVYAGQNGNWKLVNFSFTALVY